MTVVGTAEVLVTPVSTGFAQKLHNELGPAYGQVAKDAEKAGEKAGAGMGQSMGSSLKKEGGKLASIIEGVTGVPLGMFKQKLGSMEQGMAKAGGSAEGFGSKLISLGSKALLGVAAGFAVVGVAAIKAADQFDVADARFKTVSKTLGENQKAIQAGVDATDTRMVHLGFTMTETQEALGTLALSTKSTAKAEGEMGVAADLARFKHISLAEASQVLTKVNAGNNRALLQLGINLDLGNAKLSAVVKATEAAKKAKENLKAAEVALTEAVKQGAAEHKAALEKVTAAEEAVKSAQDTLKGGSEGLAGAQESLKSAQRGVAETAEKEKIAVKEATAALKAAEEAAAETARQGAKGVEEAKKGVADLETERTKESNENAIKTIEGEEKKLEGVKTAAAEGALAVLKAKKAELEAADKAIENQKKEEALSKAHRGVIEAESTAHKNNRTAINAVTQAREALRQKQKETLSTSKESVSASERVTQAERGVAAALRTVSTDRAGVVKATRALALAQKEANATSPAVVAAEAKVAAAHAALSKANKTLAKDAGSTEKVMAALAKYLHGQASAYTETLAGKMAILKAELNKAAISMGEKLMPVVLKLMPAIKGLANVIVVLGEGVAKLVGWWQDGWEKIGLFFYEHEKKIKGVVHLIIQGLLTIGTFGIYPLVKIFLGNFGKILHFFEGLPGKFANLAKAIGEAIWEGIKWGIDMVAEGLETMIHSIGLPGFSVGPVHFGGLHPFSGVHIPRLEAGAIVTVPTLAMIGEKGPEEVRPLGKPPKAGETPDLGGIHFHGSNWKASDVVRELAWGTRTGKIRFAQ